MSLKIKYIDVPQGIQQAGQAQGQGQSFADPACVLDGAQDVAYATLEPRGWSLDGTRKLLADSPRGFWWSLHRSGNNGRFSQAPTLTFTFSSDYTATGLTFVFWPSTNEWCSDVRVTWYNGSVVLREKTIAPNAPIWTLQHTVEGFNKVKIAFLSTNLPGHFAKVQQVVFGQDYWFTQDEITAVQMVNEVDPTLSELTVDTMRIDICDRQSRSLLPQKNQCMELYRDDELLAVQYVSSSSRQAMQTYSFSCQSAIGLLDAEFLGGLYEATPVQKVLDAVLEGFSYTLHERFTNSTVTGYLPICTRREALQQIVFALGAMVTTQRSRDIRIEPIPTELTTPFLKGAIFQGGQVETEPRVARVEVVAHKYTPSAEVQTLLDGQKVSGTDVLITFNEPHHSYAITGGTITGSGANWVTVTANAQVTLTGKKYLHSTVRYTKDNPKAAISERNNAVVAEQATLVHSANAEDVLKRIYNISLLRQRLTQQVVVADQSAGQKVVSENSWGGTLRGYITAMDSSLTSAGQTASVTVLGVEAESEGLAYAGSLYAGDKEETVCT